MKKLHFIAAVTLLMLLGPVYTALSQSPEGFYYQAEARDSRGRLIVNTTLTVQAGILLNSPTGDPAWEERYTVKTDKYGMFSIIIGDVEHDDEKFVSIDWEDGKYFLSVQIIYGTTTIQMPVTQLLSVPYALYAKSAGSAGNEIDPVFSISPSFDISETNIINWDDAFSWGDHSAVGYINTETQTLADVMSINNSAGRQIKNVFDPTEAQDAATKAYVDEQISKLMKFEGLVADIEGNFYRTVKIGNQTWMAENLRTTRYNDFTVIPNVYDNYDWGMLETGAYCWYNNDIAANKDKYGALYNGYAVISGKLCPNGWHVPYNLALSDLQTFLGGQYVAGGKMKETGTIEAGTGLWYDPNAGATNESGFSGRPGGRRTFIEGSFSDLGRGGYFWSLSVEGSLSEHYYSLSQNSTILYFQYMSKKDGYSVRCVKSY